ncbi:MAG: hypothetical protein F6K58_03310 [Symploca sp. SIO2E9]|nr:hypothetical protein [Symploca sp. SIO2E9]
MGKLSKQTLQTLQTPRIQVPRKISFTPPLVNLNLNRDASLRSSQPFREGIPRITSQIASHP